MKVLVPVLFGILSLNILQAQPLPIQLPKISEDHLSLTSYPPEPDAEALILYDFGKLDYVMLRSEMKLYYTYYREIKILKEEGAKFSKVSIPYDEEEAVIDIRGFTYSLIEENGKQKVQKLKLSRRTIRDEPLAGGHRQKIIQLPLPETGAVISYTYTVVTEDYESLRSWDFQAEVPVIRSEYHTVIPDDFSYFVLFQGDSRMLGQKSEFLPSPVQFQVVPNGDSPPKINGIATNDFGNRGGLFKTQYLMENVSSFVKEPFSSSPNNYLVRLMFQLNRVNYVNKGQTKYLNSFGDLNRRILADDNFGKQLAKFYKLPPEAERVALKEKDNREKLFALYELIRERLLWRGNYSVFTEKDLDKTWEFQLGNSADINLSLVSILNAAGFKAYPVLVSTRSNGKTIPTYPMLAQFNHVIVQVELKGEKIYMDATHNYNMPDMLPINSLSKQGFRVHPKKSGWVNIKPVYDRYRRTYARFILDENGKMEGKLSHRHKGYSAARTRALLSSYEDREEAFFRDHMINEFEDAVLRTHYVKDETNIEKPVSTRCELITSDFVTKNGELILIQPLLSEGYEVNPLQNPNRRLPVDLGAPVNEQYVMVLTIPEGYTFEVIPTDINVKLPRDAGSFTYQTQVVHNHLQLLSRIIINKTVFQPEEYLGIKAFFDHIAGKHGERIILRREPDQ